MGKVKICGLKSIQDIEIVNKFLPNYIGFVLAPSKRQITLEEAKRLKGLLNPKIQAVGVFVNEPIESILTYEKEKVIDMIQLHGDEDIVYLKTLKKATQLPLIKAFRMKPATTLKESLGAQYDLLQSEVLDYILLDAYHEQQYGGCGVCFDWQLLKQIHRPYFLAGGIDSDNAQQALAFAPYAIDVSSKMETDGCKDAEKISALMKMVKAYEK